MNTDFSFSYPVNLIPQDEGGFVVEFPDFPEAITQGENEEDALREAADCLEEAIANRIIMKLDIPLPQSKNHKYIVPLEVVLAAKCAFYLALKKTEYNNTFLAKQLKCDEKEIRRLLDPRYKSTKISRLEEALKFLGTRLTLSVVSSKSKMYSPESPLKPKRPPKAIAG